jgi:ATP-dependent protease ClpP protease subunit
MLFNVVNTDTEDELEIAVYDVIGRSFWGEGVGAADVRRLLNTKPKASKIRVRVYSLGGILDDAKAIINLLSEKIAAGVAVTFVVDAIAASAAAYILTTPGAEVYVAENASVMIHKARAYRGGTDSDMEAAAKILREANEVIAEGCAAASAARGKKKTKEHFLAEMAKGDRYFRADEAIAWGLADGKSPPASVKVAACLDMSEVPEALRAELERYGSPPPTTATIGSPVTMHLNVASDLSPERLGQLVTQALGGVLPNHTNHPAPPVAAAVPGPPGEGSKKMDLKVLASLLGLTEAVTEADITAELKRLKSEPPKADAAVLKALGAETQEAGAARATELARNTIALLGATGATSVEQAFAQVDQWRESAKQTAQLLVQVQNLTKGSIKNELEAMIQKLSASGKLPPVLHEWARTNFETAAKLEQFVLSAPLNFSAGNIAENLTGETTVALTDEDRAAMKATGCSEADFLAAKKKQLESRRQAVGG